MSKMLKLKPQGRNILVRRVEAQDVTRGGIIIPDTAKKKPFEGEVIEVGPGWRDDRGVRHLVSIEPGEKVLFGSYMGTEIGNELLVLSETSVLAVIGTDNDSLRAHQDNVVLLMAAQESLSSVISMVDKKARHRHAKVMLSGPGFITRLGVFVENTSKERDYVVVDADSGQDYALDLDVPRHNVRQEFAELFGHEGAFRVVRQEEVLATIDRSERESVSPVDRETSLGLS